MNAIELKRVQKKDTSPASHFSLLQVLLLFEERSDLHADRFERIP